MKTRIFDKESNTEIGEIEIPNEVIAAARTVSEWLQNHESVELCGLTLASD